VADFGTANEAVAGAFVKALATAGIEHVCITPGSRSTPLTVAFARQPAIRPWLHLDERSAAYFALGLASATGRPVALVCTSGTAAANYYPAVVEANLSRIPLLVLTADRPPRLRDVGADQTMNQAGMYGSNARWAADLPLPVGDASEARQVGQYAARAVQAAMSPLPGPVHLNFPFEEPLMAAAPEPADAASIVPRMKLDDPVVEPSPASVAVAAEALSHAARPLIVAGPETGGLPAVSIAALADVLGAPILADPLSGLRTGNHDRSRVLDSYDAILRLPNLPEFAPDCVVRFGAKPTSKALNQFLACQTPATHILCDLPVSWRDPDALSTVVLHGAPERCATAIERAVSGTRAEASWSERWQVANAAAREAMRNASLGFTETFEGRVFSELQETLPAGATILAGNSMPVRDLDSFLFSSPKPLALVANRGAAGIDGVTSSALGAAAAGNGPVVLVIGDISFYHDMNGLWAAARHQLDLTVVLVNNNGGGIFHYLPQAAHPSVFEEWFGTPPNLDFSHAVQMYGGTHLVPGSWDEFRDGLAGGSGLRVIELRTDRARNVEMHRQAWAAAARAVQSQPVS
jgi:2-succinyl-5-enolpyruvyl-6-hydroxy-3-cyclohexene-1-carboxylate synthase